MKLLKYMYRGELRTVKEVALLANINLHTLTNRLYKYGLSIEEAADAPVRKGRRRRFTEVYKRQDGVKA